MYSPQGTDGYLNYSTRHSTSYCMDTWLKLGAQVICCGVRALEASIGLDPVSRSLEHP